MKRLVTLVASMAFIGLQITRSVSAADFNGLGLAPGPATADRDPGGFHYRLSSGETVTDAIKLINTTNANKHVRLAAIDATISKDNRFVCPPTNSAQTKWISISQSFVVLSAHDSLAIPFTITVPAKAAGEYNICFISQEATSVNRGAIPLTSRLAMRVSIVTDGSTKVAAKLTPSDIAIGHNTIDYRAYIANVGNTSLSATTTVMLSGLRYKQHHNQAKQLILPRATLPLHGAFKRPVFGGWYHLDITMEAQQSISSWARTNEKSQQSIRQTIFVWPHPGILCALSGLALLSSAYVYKKSRHRRDL